MHTAKDESSRQKKRILICEGLDGLQSEPFGTFIYKK
jgi:hypothetical protein